MEGRDGRGHPRHLRADALRDAVSAALAEGYRSLSRITEFLDYEPLPVEELAKRNPKVTLSFFRVKSPPIDVGFAEETLKKLK